MLTGFNLRSIYLHGNDMLRVRALTWQRLRVLPSIFTGNHLLWLKIFGFLYFREEKTEGCQREGWCGKGKPSAFRVSVAFVHYRSQTIIAHSCCLWRSFCRNVPNQTWFQEKQMFPPSCSYLSAADFKLFFQIRGSNQPWSSGVSVPPPRELVVEPQVGQKCLITGPGRTHINFQFMFCVTG